MSYLIIGGTSEDRRGKAEEIVRIKYKVSSFDAVFLSGETSIGIEQVRQLQHQLSLKPYNSPVKAAIIHPGELLTVEAQNAFLKTLEETSKNTIIILTAPAPEFLLPTVVSRCQLIRLAPKQELELNQEEFTSVVRLLSSVLRGEAGERLKMVSGVGKEREEIKKFLNRLLVVCREILLSKSGVNSSPRCVSLLKQHQKVNSLTTSQILQMVRNLERAKSQVEQNANPRLVLEIFFLDLPRLPYTACRTLPKCTSLDTSVNF